MEDVKNNRGAKQTMVHGGLTGKIPAAPEGYGVKGMRNVADGACRSETAPQPKSIGGRTA